MIAPLKTPTGLVLLPYPPPHPGPCTPETNWSGAILAECQSVWHRALSIYSVVAISSYDSSSRSKAPQDAQSCVIGRRV